MKNLLILLFVCFMISCKSQSPVYTMGDGTINIPQNAYLKDTENVLNKFAGTWTYSENGKIFSIILNKAEMVKLINYYVDELQGSYFYSNNGNMIVNTATPVFAGENSRIFGAILWEGDDNKVTLFFKDPERSKMSAEVTLTYSNQNGVKKLHWQLKHTGTSPQLPGDSAPLLDFRVPTDVYLIKQ